MPQTDRRTFLDSRLQGLSLFAALILTNSAAGQTVTDGDTLKQGGIIYRLYVSPS
jgi:hypothetical protein